MKEYFIQEETLKEIANAIREKALINEDLTPAEMAEIISTKTYSDEDLRLWAYLSQSIIHMQRATNPIYFDKTLSIDYTPIDFYLQDFQYINNSDGTYTIIDWDGTKDGLLSTELILPNQSNIIL